MTIMDVSPAGAMGKAYWIWFAERPASLKTFEYVEYKEASDGAFIPGCKPEVFETLFSDLRESEECLRNKLSAAKKRDLRIASNRTWTTTCDQEIQMISQFHSLHVDFCQKRGIHGPHEIAILLRNREHCVIAFTLNEEKRPICWNYYVMSGQFVRLWYSGSDSFFNRNDCGYAVTLLHWRMMLHFKTLGFQTYDWGGASTDPHSATYGISQFKASFGGEPVKRYNFRVTQESPQMPIRKNSVLRRLISRFVLWKK
jgi:hypothetical protein